MRNGSLHMAHYGKLFSHWNTNFKTLCEEKGNDYYTLNEAKKF